MPLMGSLSLANLIVVVANVSLVQRGIKDDAVVINVHLGGCYGMGKSIT